MMEPRHMLKKEHPHGYLKRKCDKIEVQFSRRINFVVVSFPTWFISKPLMLPYYILMELFSSSSFSLLFVHLTRKLNTLEQFKSWVKRLSFVAFEMAPKSFLKKPDKFDFLGSTEVLQKRVLLVNKLWMNMKSS